MKTSITPPITVINHTTLLTPKDKKLNKNILLKPCPFCGGKAIQRYDNAIYCEQVTSCGANVDFGNFGGNSEEESTICRQAVADAWNKRW